MTQPKTICQYKKFLDDLGVHRSQIREEFGDLRRLDTWKAAYTHYSWLNLPIIKYLNESRQEENNLTPSEPPILPPQKPPEIVEIAEAPQSSSTLEQEHRPLPTLPLSLYLPSFNRGEKSKFNQLEVVGVNWVGKTSQLTLPTKTQIPLQLPPPPPELKILTLIWSVSLPMKINFQLCEKCVGERSPPDKIN